jgi:hypothetical protein
MTSPFLFEVHTRQWLHGLSQKWGREIDLYAVPEDELDAWENYGFTHIWLMGVWPTGTQSRKQALTHPDLRRAYTEALPNWADVDVVGSPYAIASAHVAPAFGGDEALALFRERLAERGMKLILDFVPNHLGLDHPWVQSKPELFVSSATPVPEAIQSGNRWILHGKDPWFPGWTDTVQVDYRKRAARTAMRDLVASIAKRCDGVRCDMAMLELPDIFERTWAHVPLETRDDDVGTWDFWRDTIAHVKADNAGFVFLAEAYWDTEPRLQELGFDFTYDKTLADLVLHKRAWDVQPHLLGLGVARVARSAHFLENHDEKRAAAQLNLEEHRAAALATLGVPGMRFMHDGQIEGARVFARIQLGRHADEAVDGDIQRLYTSLLTTLKESLVGSGEAQLMSGHRAWDDNPSAQCITLVQWSDPKDPTRFDLVVVNHAPHRAQCYAPLCVPELAGGQWHLHDQLGFESHTRDGDDLASRGLYLDVDAHATQLFRFSRV